MFCMTTFVHPHNASITGCVQRTAVSVIPKPTERVIRKPTGNIEQRELYLKQQEI